MTTSHARRMAALLAATTLSFAGSAFADDKVVKIGVLNDMSSLYADIGGPNSVAAINMAVEDSGMKAKGWTIEVISGDHQNKPDIGVNIGRQWIDTQKVDVIMDTPNSGVALAVSNLVKEKNSILINSGGASADLTGKACNANTISYTYDTYMLANGTGKALTKAGGDTWFFLTADYAFGAALERDTSAVVTANGGKVLGAVRPPFATPDLSSFILQAQASKAKIIGIAGGPPNNTNEIKTAAEFGVFAGGQQMAALLALITDIHSIGLSAAQGLLLTTSFYWDMDDKTREWSKRYFAKMNRMPTMWQAGVYSSVTAYLNAIKETGTDDPLKVAAKMREKPVEDFFARNGRLREDNLMVHDLWLVQVKTPAESKYPWDYYKILAKISGEDAFGPPDPACAMAKK